MTVVRFPACHGYGGFAIRHETKTANQLARSLGQLRRGGSDSIRNAVIDISAFRYRNPFIKFWIDCADIYWRQYRAILRFASSF